MRSSKTKTTVIAIIALIIVCGGSFAGVKMLNRTEVASTIANTISSTFTTAAPSTSATTTSPVISEASTLPAATTAAPVNAENESASAENVGISADESTTQAASEDRFTTFATTSNSNTAASTTKPAATAQAQTTRNNNFTVTNQEEANALIEQAGTVSDGFFGYLYDAAGNFFYTSNDPWQRQFGFNQLYDTGAPFVNFYYDTMRCKFRYNNKDWMIQFWKGQYGFVFLGCEIGVYYKPTDRTVEHYDCVPDEDCLPMSLTFYRKGEQKAERDYAKYWWCTAFVPGTLDNFSDRSELEVRARITMNDPVMLLAFCNSLKKNGYVLNENFTVNGLDVFVIY